MHSSSLGQLITADALRSAVRAIGVLREIRRGAHSVPRGLLESNGAVTLQRELLCLRGLGDLLAPVSTTLEIQTRAERIDRLLDLVPSSPGLLQTAILFCEADQRPKSLTRAEDDSVKGGEAQGDKANGDDASRRKKAAKTLIISGRLRGELVAADEMSLRALDTKVRRRLGPEGETLSGQQQLATASLVAESTSWRLLENSQLANRLIADHGFANAYAQARKRARALLKDEASKGLKRPKTSDMRALQRWHEALRVQLDTLAAIQTLGHELQILRDQLGVLGKQLELWLSLMRLRGVSGGLQRKAWREQTDAQLDSQSAAILVSVQRSYGLGKSNFRSLIGSELELPQ